VVGLATCLCNNVGCLQWLEISGVGWYPIYSDFILNSARGDREVASSMCTWYRRAALAEALSTFCFAYVLLEYLMVYRYFH
jgi:hypothetical protein